jgi:macrolide transport system ATP-binding/permease protein
MPNWNDEIRRRLAEVRLSAADEANVTEELHQHLDDRYHDLRAKGASHEVARRAALEELGEDGFLDVRMRGAIRRAPEPVPIGAREGRGVAGIWGDLRFGARMLRRAPGFTVTAALTIALGIGANTTIFSILNALLLRPLPGTVRSNELVLLGRTQQGQGFDTFSYPDFLDYRAGSRTLSAVVATTVIPAHVSTGGASERVRAELVTGDYFATLGTHASLGRLLIAADADDGAPPVAVLSHGAWQSRFGADRTIVGRNVRINGAPYTVVGVAEERFNGVRLSGVVDVFLPMTTAMALLPDAGGMRDQRGAVWLNLFGRLAPRSSLAQAQAELSTIATALATRFPETNKGRGLRVSPGLGLEPSTRGDIAKFMTILVGVVGLVLLIACANVANLLLARGSARARELAVRASLGASRSRLVRQLLAEGFLLAVLGGAAGFALGVWSLRLALRLPVFANSFGALAVGIDPRVVTFGAAAMVLSGLLFALPPAFRTSRVDLVTALKLGTPGSGDIRSRLRGGLVVAQLALSLVLLVAAGLFVRTLQALYRIEPGFDTGRVLVATVDPGMQGYDEARMTRLFEEFQQRVRAVPGVERAAMGFIVPLGGGGWDSRVYPFDVKPTPDDPGIKSDINAVFPGYFETLGMRLLNGRDFTAGDRPGGPAVAVVNEALAEELWPGGNALGQRFRLGRGGNEVLEVVGVVRTARYRSLVEPPRPFLYRPFSQAFRASMTMHVRVASGDPYVVLPAVRRALDEIDRDLPLSRVQTLEQRLSESVGAQRTAATLVGTYGLLALVLAAVGLYGSMAYSVSRRTREMGVRMALGAHTSDVRRHVLLQALRIAALGVVIGLIAAVPATRFVRSQLVGVEPDDPVTLTGVIAVLVAAAVAAAYVPARRATRVDPVVALRSE